MQSSNFNNNLSISYERGRLIFIVFLCILFFWVIDSTSEAIFGGKKSTFLEELIDPSAYLMRFIIIILFILLLGIYFRRVLIDMKNVNHTLKQEISERHQAEQAYKSLFRNYELILNSAPFAIYGLDAHGIVTFVNPAVCKITSYAPDELIGQDMHNILHQQRLDGTPYPRTDCLILDTLRTGVIQENSQDWFWTKDGTSFPVEYVSSPIEENGQVTGVVVIFRDITSQLLSKAQLQKERDFISTLMDTVDALVMVLDPQGRILRFNRACERVSGYLFEEVKGRIFWEFLLLPEEVERVKRLFNLLHNGLDPGVVESNWIPRTGEPRLIAWSNTVLMDNQESVTHIIGTGIDVTAQRRAEHELRQAKDYLENVFENSADAIGIVDRRGKILKWNKAASQVFGYSFGELEGRSSFELYADRQELHTMLDLLRRQGSVRRYEIEMKKKNGIVGLFALSINLLYDQNQKIIGSVCVARDRSEIKKTLDDLAAVNKQLHHEISERKQVEAALQEANHSLHQVIREFEQRNHDITLLNEMGDLLQACLTCSEAYAWIAHFASQLFPDDAGVLFILQAPRKLMEAMVTWGEPDITQLVFSPNECWALRRGEIHTMPINRPGLACPHLIDAPPAGHTCIPLIAQGEIMGLILLENRLCRTDSPEPLRDQLSENKQRLALTLAKQISLALANLKLRDSLQAQAFRDPLTGLFNRRYMEETLEREVQRVKRREKSLSVIMIDLDFLKPINDSFGHEAGDKVISTLGHFLQTHVRREDVVCRYGGDEFILILPEAPIEIACQRAEELRSGISELHAEYTGHSLGPISASFGIATFPDHGSAAEELVRAADAALYQAKLEGRNQVRIALPPEKAEPAGKPEPEEEQIH